MIMQLQHAGSTANGISETKDRKSTTHRNSNLYEWIGELVEGIRFPCALMPVAAIIATTVQGMSQ
jgi:hypothetical protein